MRGRLPNGHNLTATVRSAQWKAQGTIGSTPHKGAVRPPHIYAPLPTPFPSLAHPHPCTDSSNSPDPPDPILNHRHRHAIVSLTLTPSSTQLLPAYKRATAEPQPSLAVPQSHFSPTLTRPSVFVCPNTGSRVRVSIDLDIADVHEPSFKARWYN